MINLNAENVFGLPLWGWILAVVILLAAIAIIAFLIFGIVILIKKRIRASKDGIGKLSEEEKELIRNYRKNHSDFDDKDRK